MNNFLSSYFIASQYPAITICPGAKFTGDSMGFVEKYLNMLDPAAQANRDTYGAIPELLAEHRQQLNEEYFRYKEGKILKFNSMAFSLLFYSEKFWGKRNDAVNKE